MKRLITLLIILFCVNVQAQVSVKDANNSTTTTLDSAATYTGTVRLVAGWNSISVTVYSDSAGTLQVQFGNKTGVTFTPTKYYFASYTANDTAFTRSYPVDAPYYRVLFTSSADTQNTFILTTMLHQNHVLGVDINGNVKVSVESSSLPTGGATSAKQDIQITRATADSLNLVAIEASVDSLKADLATAKGYLEAVKDTLNVLKNKDFATETSLSSVIDSLSMVILQNVNRNLFLDEVSENTSGATKYFGETDTVTTRIDTFEVDVTSWVEGEIIASDSIEVCIDGAFTAGNTFIITETTAVSLPRWGGQSTTALYIRRYGGAGTSKYYIRLHGR